MKINTKYLSLIVDVYVFIHLMQFLFVCFGNKEKTTPSQIKENTTTIKYLFIYLTKQMNELREKHSSIQ